MSKSCGDPNLIPILEKVQKGTRITEHDAVTLYQSPDFQSVAEMAHHVRERMNGNVVTYLHNRYINYSNLCVLSCQFCAFGARKRDAHAFELGIEEIVARVREGLALGITEVHMVGGLHPTLGADWYLRLLTELRQLSPTLFIKAFTAIEIRHLSDRVFKKPLRETFEILRSAGLGGITGGGAEIFDQSIRDQICRGKETAEEWLEVHRTWHDMGERSTCTMLFGHIETHEQRADHLRRLRELQDETGGFVGFVPFAFIPETPAMAHLPAATAEEQLRNLAVARIYLDNIPHITAYWVSLGLELAQRSLACGADDIHGTLVEEKVLHMAGVQSPERMTVSQLRKIIRDAGFEPMQRNSRYVRISRTDLPQAADMATAA